MRVNGDKDHQYSAGYIKYAYLFCVSGCSACRSSREAESIHLVTSPRILPHHPLADPFEEEPPLSRPGPAPKCQDVNLIVKVD